jgi:preprotein translocase subunit SecB
MSYKIIGKYIKKLIFNIPDPKTFFLLSKNISNYKINIDIKSEQIKEKIIEVQTTLNLTPLKQEPEIIDTKITFATIIELSKEINNKKDIEKIVLIKIPQEIYPELRKIFVFVFENSGFKDVKISESVDFQKLYDLRKVQ